MRQKQQPNGDNDHALRGLLAKKRPSGQNLKPRAIEAAKRQFLQTLEQTINVAEACRQAGISRPTAVHWRALDPDFAEAWQAAMDAALDDLEHTAQRRAHEGSDLLLMFLLKANRPGKYRENTIKHEHTGNEGGPINVQFFTFNAVASSVIDAGLEGGADDAVAAALTDGSAADR